MYDFNITDLQEIGSKNKELFGFILINLAHYEINY